MKKLLIILLCLISSLFIGCDTTSKQIEKDPLAFSSPVNDIFYKEPIVTPKMDDVLKEAKKIKQSVPENAQENNENNQLQVLAQEELNENFEIPVIEEESYEKIEESSEEIEESSEEINEDGLTAQSGVNSYDGRTETYYSSNSLYHQDTDDWTVDDEGFYRTDEGYYVVAASDMPQGTVFEGSMGTCIVLDDGCEEGITDYYTNW